MSSSMLLPPCEPNDRELIVCVLQVPSNVCGSVISNLCAPASGRMSHECTMCPLALGSFLVLNCMLGFFLSCVSEFSLSLHCSALLSLEQPLLASSFVNGQEWSMDSSKNSCLSFFCSRVF